MSLMAKVIGTYILIQAISLIAFWVFLDGAYAMGYTILFIWTIQPVTIFALSFLITKNKYFTKAQWLFPLIFGIGYLLLPYCTFDMANMLSAGILLSPSWEPFGIGVVVSIAGLLIGKLTYKHKES